MIREETTQLYILNRSFLFILVISLASLVVSYWVEIVDEKEPCKICLLQRLCYFALATFSFLGIILNVKRTLSLSVFAVAFASFLMACYHIGIQTGFFVDSCAIVSPVDLNDFTQMLFKPKQTCSSVHWFFGIPISVWSFFISLINFVIMVNALRTQKIIINKIAHPFNPKT